MLSKIQFTPGLTTKSAPQKKGGFVKPPISHHSGWD
jgi:hypothetical protein